MEYMHSSRSIVLSAVRICGMDITHDMALNMCESPHLTIPYLLRDEQGDLESKSLSWIGNIKD